MTALDVTANQKKKKKKQDENKQNKDGLFLQTATRTVHFVESKPPVMLIVTSFEHEAEDTMTTDKTK